MAAIIPNRSVRAAGAGRKNGAMAVIFTCFYIALTPLYMLSEEN